MRVLSDVSYRREIKLSEYGSLKKTREQIFSSGSMQNKRSVNLPQQSVLLHHFHIPTRVNSFKQDYFHVNWRD